MADVIELVQNGTETVIELIVEGPQGEQGPPGPNAANVYATRAALVSAIGSGLTVATGSVVYAGGIFYIGSSGATAITDLPGLLPIAPVMPEHFGAAGDGVTNDLTAINRMITYGKGPVRLRNTYRVSTYPTVTDLLWELESTASLNIDGGLTWLPRHYVELDTVIFQKKTLPSGTNPISVEPVGYDFVETSYMNERYLINQWGKQSLSNAANRTGIYLAKDRLVNSGEGDGYIQFWDVAASPHGRTGSAVNWNGQNSTGMAGGQATALGANVNLYGIGDMVLKDMGFDDVALLGQVTYLYHDGGNSGLYDVPRFGHYIANLGANPIDAALTIGGPMLVGYDASGADITGAAFAMAEGMPIVFDAEPTASNGKFSTQDVGAFYMKKPVGVNAIEIGRGADDVYLWRVAGASASVRATMGVAGTGAYFSALSEGSDSTFIAFRTSQSGNEVDRLTITTGGSLNILTAGASLQFGGVGALFRGAGSPEGVIAAAVGTMYLRSDGGAGTSLYVKESGTGNTGWVAK